MFQFRELTKDLYVIGFVAPDGSFEILFSCPIPENAANLVELLNEKVPENKVPRAKDLIFDDDTLEQLWN